jgi:hypothetical protein
MSFDPKPGDEIHVGVDLVSFDLERRRESIAAWRVSAIEDDGGFHV